MEPRGVEEFQPNVVVSAILCLKRTNRSLSRGEIAKAIELWRSATRGISHKTEKVRFTKSEREE